MNYTKMQKLVSVRVWRCMSAVWRWGIYWILKRRELPSEEHLFSRGLGLFLAILPDLRQRGFHRHRVSVWLTCLQFIFLMLKMYGASRWGQSDNDHRWNLIQQEQPQIALAKLQQLMSSAPDWLKSVLKGGLI